MFKLIRSKSLTHLARNGLIKNSQRYYQTISADEYLLNQRDANISRNVHEKKLYPLANSNHSEGTTDEITLIGVPNGSLKEEYDTLTGAMEANHPDLILLQVNPEPYIARQRFLAHKCALKEVEDYEKNGLEKIDPDLPHSWEECVVNLVVLDMLRENKVHTNLQLADGFFAYSYPFHQDPNTTKQLTKPFINSITENIIYDNFSQYHLINQALYTSLLGKHKVLLGEMPELLLRQKLGNTLSVGELRDLFKFVLTKRQELKIPISMKDATLDFLPHIFQAPKDYYMTAMLKEAFQAATCIVGMVGLPHFNPIQRYWEPAPHGINYEEATRIPERIKGESDEEQIEKQAILDVMLESRAWGKSYISNPFPYLIDDITKVKDDDLKKLKKTFMINYKKYESFKLKNYKELGGGNTSNIFITANPNSKGNAAKVLTK